MRFEYASDQALLLSLGDAIGPETHRRVREVLAALEREPVPEICNLHPAYCSVLIRFDPVLATHAGIEAAVRERLGRAGEAVLPEPKLVEIPVLYGGAGGPDLEGVAALHGMRLEEVIRVHSEAEYTVNFLGFAPGFAYLGGLPEALATPRLPSPRKRVPAGSVGIAGNQTGVYPFATPGGWQLIGRTELEMFSPARDPMALLALGDRVRFRPVSAG